MAPVVLSLNHGRARLDTLSRQLVVDGTVAKLSGRAFDLLVALVERHQRLVSKHELMDLVWPGLAVEEGNLHVHVFALRRWLGAEMIVTVPGRGYRFAGRVDTAAAAAARLPMSQTHVQGLVGREALLDEVVAALERPLCRLLTLVGPGGAGKTRLALAAMARMEPLRAGGVRTAMLASVPEVGGLWRALATALDLQDDAPSLEAAVLGYFKAHDTLLLLDNLEHLGGAAAWIAELMRMAPRLQLLGTSRQRLHLREEHLVTVMPLPLPVDASASAIRASPAVSLFMQHAELQGREMGTRPEDLLAAAEICRRLDGLPLAIELVAPRLQVMTPSLLAERLAQRLDLLTNGALDTQPPHHRSLREALAWSYDLLDEHAQQLFRRLGVFAGGWSLAAAEGLLSDRNLAWQALEQLLQHHLVQRASDVNAELRFSMLETVREFAAEALGAAGERDASEQARAHWAAQWAESLQQQLFRGERPQAMAAYRADRANADAALRWAFESANEGTGDAALQARLVTHRVELWDHDNDALAGQQWFARIQLDEVPLALRVDLLLGGAALANSLCRFEAGAGLAAQAAALARADGNPRQQAVALCHQARAESDPETALTLLRSGQTQLETLGHTNDAALALWSLGKRMAQEGGRDDEAARVLADAGQRFAAQGDRWMAAMVRIQQAMLLLRRGQRTAALPALAEGEAVALEYEDSFNAAHVLHLRARIARDDGQLEAALTRQHEAIRLLLASGEARVAVQHLRWTAHLHTLRGATDIAVQLLAACEGRFGDVGFLSLTSVSADDRAEWQQTGVRLRELLRPEQHETCWREAVSWTPAQALARSIAAAGG